MMVAALIVVGYVVLGIGTARAAYTAEYTHLAVQIANRTGNKRVPSRAEVHHEMEPVGLYPVLSGVFWPLALPVGLAWLIGRVFGPLINKWWYAGVNRKLRKAGLS